MGWGLGTDRASAAGRVRACALKGMNLSACTDVRLDGWVFSSNLRQGVRRLRGEHVLLQASNYYDWLG